MQQFIKLCSLSTLLLSRCCFVCRRVISGSLQTFFYCSVVWVHVCSSLLAMVTVQSKLWRYSSVYVTAGYSILISDVAGIWSSAETYPASRTAGTGAGGRKNSLRWEFHWGWKRPEPSSCNLRSSWTAAWWEMRLRLLWRRMAALLLFFKGLRKAAWREQDGKIITG